jgi:DnaJ family protein A protein 2
MKTCAYEILGVPKTASDTDIKKAYRIQAIKCHPDKNPENKQAEEDFKKLSEAYSVLSSPDKKAAYDNFGWGAVSGDGQSATASPFNFGFGGDPFFNMFFNQQQGINRTVRKPEPILEKVVITFEELYCGFNRTVKFNKNAVCTNCYGTGSQSKKNHKCTTCNGSGMKIEIRKMGPMIQQIQGICNTCSGTGEMVDKNDLCVTCNGKKIISKVASENINTQGSYPTGHKITFKHKGHELPTGVCGDLIVEIQVSALKHWKRESSESLNIVHRCKTSLQEHYYSTHMFITHLDGSVLRLPKKNINKKINMFKIPNMGLKDANNYSNVGNLIILLDIVLPETLENINSTSSPSKEHLEKCIDIETIIEANTICNQYFKTYDEEKNNKFTSNNDFEEEKPECVQQ